MKQIKKKNNRDPSHLTSKDVHPLLRTERWKSLRRKIYAKYNGICAYCSTITIPKHPYLNYNVDHIRPISHTSASPAQVFDESNLQLLCSFCHLQKTNKEQSTRQPSLSFISSDGDISLTPFEEHKAQFRKLKKEYLERLKEEGKI